MKIEIGQTVNVVDAFFGKELLTKTGIVKIIDHREDTPFPVFVKFEQGGCGWFTHGQLTNFPPICHIETSVLENL